jgi:hypothetical protein
MATRKRHFADLSRLGTLRQQTEWPDQRTMNNQAAMDRDWARSRKRLPAALLQKVTPKHVWTAVQKLLGGHQVEPFGQSTDFDLIADDGQRLPPKAVFGIAASDAPGFQVLPRHFTGGVDTLCFRILEDSGYNIVPKDAATPAIAVPRSYDDEAWAEGNPKLVTHLKRERAKGLAQAKKADFKAVNGALLCERCGLGCCRFPPLT